MLSFAVYRHGKPLPKLNLDGAYVIGTDDVPLRAELSFKNGIITCKKRAAGPAGIALLWPIEGVGTILIETIRVLERERPYVLQVELARGRLLRITHKLEEWGLLDYQGTEEQAQMIDRARDLLIEALSADDPARAADLGEQSISAAVRASESLTRFHSQAMLARRKQSGSLGPRTFGCGVSLDAPGEAARKRIAAAFDFVTLPILWRDVEPAEQNFNWKPLDTWVETLTRAKIPIRGSALLSFNESNIPDWLYIWEHDFDTIRDLAFEHIRRVINRYGQYIQNWTVVSGLHASNCFTFSFEQLLELTRMAAALTRQLAPRGVMIVELVAPWGEYYARNQRTIPPFLYSDMVLQSGVMFDGFGLRMEFGGAADGGSVRDLFQISAMLDHFSKAGKPLHVTGVEAPSQTSLGEEATPEEIAAVGGVWHQLWSEDTQSQWLRCFVEIALSKTFVESVSWQHLADHASQRIPFSGLLRSDLAPKAAYRELIELRNELLGNPTTAAGPAE